jgi:hypothetical protein
MVNRSALAAFRVASRAGKYERGITGLKHEVRRKNQEARNRKQDTGF